MHGITEVLYESCWRLARTTLEHDVSVTSLFSHFSFQRTEPLASDGFPRILRGV